MQNLINNTTISAWDEKYFQKQTFVSSKEIIEFAYLKAVQKIKEMKYSTDEFKKQFLISMIIETAYRNGVHFNNVNLFSICKRVKKDFNVSFKEIYIINKNLRLNKIEELTEKEKREVSLFSFFEKFMKDAK